MRDMKITYDKTTVTRVKTRKRINDKQLAERLRRLRGSLKGKGLLRALMEEKRREQEY
jgi:hypothetical protein